MHAFEIDDSHRYLVTLSKDNNDFKNSFSNEKSKISTKKRKLNIEFDYIYLISILSILMLLIALIIYLANISKYRTTYKFKENAYIKSKYSSHEYSSITFDNGLKLVLVQVNTGDLSGGVISFDTGYLDTRFEPGYLRLAFMSLISNETSKSETLAKYMGNFNYAVEEFYSSFYFNILGEGFLDYLKDFSKLTYLENDDERYNDIKNIDPKGLNITSSTNVRKKHLLEYLVYGYKNDTNEMDIMPYGAEDTIYKLNGNYTIIKEIMSILLSNPTKIKIILYSHYKMSLVKKTFLNYFNKIINFKQKMNNKFFDDQIKSDYKLDEFAKKKFIYHLLPYNNEINYLEIIYFLSNDNVSYNELYKDSQYLLYISYILNEANNGSLYHELTHNNKNISINSLSSNIEVVLKSKIKFSINILLNYYSYTNILDIIRIVHEYMNKIKIFMDSKKDLVNNDIRAKELFIINEQNFTFFENSQDDNFYIKKAKDLFYKDETDFYLKEMWFNEYFCKNITRIKKYYEQLTPNNSNVFLGLKSSTVNRYKIKRTDISFVFKDIKNTNYLDLQYSIHDLDTSYEDSFDTNISYLINPKPNDYISKYNSESMLDYEEFDEKKYFLSEYEEISNSSDINLKVFFKKDISFHLPKIYVNIYFFHPFLRPNFNYTISDELYFKYILFMAYIKRTIKEKLADAFRAGDNSFKIEQNENFVDLDLYIFSDKAKKALNTIKDIFDDKDDFTKQLNERFEIYRDMVIEDFLQSSSYTNNYRLKVSFFQSLTKNKNNNLPPIFNYCFFPISQYYKKTYKDVENDIFYVFNSIKYIYLFGYYSKSEAEEIYNIYNKTNDFKAVLEQANYNLSEINESSYVNWSLEKGKIKETLKKSCPEGISRNGFNTYRYMVFSEYNLKTECILNMLIKILSPSLKMNNTSISLLSYSQNFIYIRFNYEKSNNSTNNEEFINYLIEYLGNRTDMKKEVDVIGDKFYYLLKNYKKFSRINHVRLSDSAESASYKHIYKAFINNEILDFNMDKYEDFVDYIEAVLQPKSPYIEIACYK